MMQYSNKSIKKEIYNTIRMIAIIAFGGGMNKIQQPIFIENCAGASFYQRLINMIDEGKINEAENELLEMINVDQKDDLKLSLSIYNYLNMKEDDFLIQNNYSRQEIADGVNNILSIFGYDGLIF